MVENGGVPAWAGPRSRVDDTLVKTLARAFRWRRLLETGDHGTVEEIARGEGINPSYVSRILRLTLLAPDIVEAILDGRQPPQLTLARLMKPFSAAGQVREVLDILAWRAGAEVFASRPFAASYSWSSSSLTARI